MSLQAAVPGLKIPPLLPFDQYAPDQPPIAAMAQALNVVPQSTGYYGPLRQPISADTNDLSSFGAIDRAAGLHSRTEADGTRVIYAGTLHSAAGGCKLVIYDETAETWADATKSGGYTLAATDQWRFANFGERCIACSGHSNPLQNETAGIGATFADLAAAAPRAKDIATVRDFLVAIDTWHSGDTPNDQPESIWNCAIGDPTSWPTLATAGAVAVQSSRSFLRGGGRLMRVVPGIGGNDAIVIAEQRVWRMNYAGGAGGRVWSFDLALNGQGTQAPGSVAIGGQGGELCFFLGADDFYAFDGVRPVPLGAGKIWRDWIGKVRNAPSAMRSVISAVDTEEGLVFWSFRTGVDSGSLWVSSGGDQMVTDTGDRLITAAEDLNDATLVYNWRTGKWAEANLGWDAIARIETDKTSTRRPEIALLDQDFKLKRFAGTPLEALLETREVFAQTGLGQRVHRVRPLIDTDSVEIRLRLRDSIAAALTDTAYRPLETDGQAHLEAVGRYYRAGLRIAAGVAWGQAIGVMFETEDYASKGLRG